MTVRVGRRRDEVVLVWFECDDCQGASRSIPLDATLPEVQPWWEPYLRVLGGDALEEGLYILHLCELCSRRRAGTLPTQTNLSFLLEAEQGDKA